MLFLFTRILRLRNALCINGATCFYIPVMITIVNLMMKALLNIIFVNTSFEDIGNYSTEMHVDKIHAVVVVFF